MATTGKAKKRKVVSKDDLRRLMKEKQSSLKPKQKKIESPLAKYNNLGQLTCVVCQAPVKSELLWPAHLQGRTHKENIALLKAEKDRKEHAFVQPPSPPSGNKRKHKDSKSETKKHKESQGKADGLPSDFFDSEVSSSRPSKPRSILKTSNVYKKQQTDSSSSSEDENDAAHSAPAPAPDKSGSSAVTDLPSDFFDANVTPSGSVEGSTESGQPGPSSAGTAEKLPEGFFDDPKLDAKARHVEYRDKMEDEWELFQKTINAEDHVSEAILAEDEEEANEERKLTEVEEQLKKYSKITDLVKQKEVLMGKEPESENKTSSDDEDVDEQEFEEFLDWRTKKVWKS